MSSKCFKSVKVIKNYRCSPKPTIEKTLKKYRNNFGGNMKSLYICTHQNERKEVLKNNADVM